MPISIDEVRAFWDDFRCGSRLSSAAERTQYFAEVSRRRYQIEPHVPGIANFEAYCGKQVLEIGCGIGTDGAEFARAGADYSGLDLSEASLAIARERLLLAQLRVSLVAANGELLPFPANRFDHVYSFGVIHHSPDPARVVAELFRVLRPGGTFTVMLYNATSINYVVEIMFLRKWLRQLLRIPVAPGFLAGLLGVSKERLEGHRKVLLAKPSMSHDEWVSRNTDGPDCPLSRVYSRRGSLRLFSSFDDVESNQYYFDASHWGRVGRMMPRPLVERLGRLWGWHRIVTGRKPA